ncbi:MAG: HEAT repeat domain-containing protein [Candidatus Thorarchaeota archaeon]
MAETRRLLLEYETEEVGRLARKKPKVRKALVKAFSDASDIVRQRALFAALDLGDPTIVTDVVKALSDDEPEVRVIAAEVLAWYHQPRTIPDLFKGLKDSDTWVRSHCASGLSKLVNGPIWARVKSDDVDKFIDDFPDMDDLPIEEFLASLKVRPDAIDKFMGWRHAKFDIEIDMSMLAAEMEGTPIILEGAIKDTPLEGIPTGISPEVVEIMSELPDELRAALPEEDIRRLTTETARQLVDSLLTTLPSGDAEPKKKKKAVKVKRVRKVRKKKKESARDSLISRIPDEVKDSLPDGTLESLTIDELEALVSPIDEPEEPVETAPKKKKKKPKTPKKLSAKRKQLLESIPPVIRESLSDENLASMSDEDLQSLIETDEPADQEDSGEPTLESLTKKFGDEKAAILILMPPDMLEGIPDEQIDAMDEDTLKGLADALEPME